MERSLEDTARQPLPSWRADLHGRYWFVGTDLAVYAEVDMRDETDEGRYETGNYFSTRTEAVRTAKWIYAGIQYIRGGHMDACIARLIEARHITEKVTAWREGQ